MRAWTGVAWIEASGVGGMGMNAAPPAPRAASAYWWFARRWLTRIAAATVETHARVAGLSGSVKVWVSQVRVGVCRGSRLAGCIIPVIVRVNVPPPRS